MSSEVPQGTVLLSLEGSHPASRRAVLAPQCQRCSSLLIRRLTPISSSNDEHIHKMFALSGR